MRRKLLEDATWHCRIALQVDPKRRCRRKGVFHSEPFLELLGMAWEQFTRRLERQFKRRGWDWSDYGSRNLRLTIDCRAVLSICVKPSKGRCVLTGATCKFLRLNKTAERTAAIAKSSFGCSRAYGGIDTAAKLARLPHLPLSAKRQRSGCVASR